MRKLMTYVAAGLVFAAGILGLGLSNGRVLHPPAAQAGLWDKVKKKAKSAAGKVAKTTKRVGRGIKRVAKDQVRGARIGWKITKQVFKRGVHVRCCGMVGRIGEPVGNRRDHRKYISGKPL